jgi:mRNA interferase MazF
MSDLPRHGEVWWCEPPEIGRRPVVVISRDVAIPRLRRALVAPCTTTVRGLPSEVLLEPGEDPIPRRCVANLDSLESVAVAVLTERIGTLSGQRMHEICAAMAVAADCA